MGELKHAAPCTPPSEAATDGERTRPAETRVRAAAQRIPRARLYVSGRTADRELAGRRRLPRARPKSCVSRWSRATTASSRWWRGCGSRACSRTASNTTMRWTAQRAGARPVRRPPGRDQGRHSRRARREDAARTAYLEAMVSPGAELLDRGFVQMKLGDLPGAHRPRRRAPAAARRPPTSADPPSRRRRGPAAAAPERALDDDARLSFALRCCRCALVVGVRGQEGHRPSRRPSSRRSSRRSTCDKLWSGKVGGESERLRLGLRPATDGARIYAGAYDGQVASFDAETGAQGLGRENRAAADGRPRLRRRACSRSVRPTACWSCSMPRPARSVCAS